MHVITRKRLVEFGKAFPDAITPLDDWYRVIKAKRFSNWGELKAIFGSADTVGKFVVFNIGGNKYRVVVNVHYATTTNMGRVYVRFVFTHAQYDRWSDQHR